MEERRRSPRHDIEGSLSAALPVAVAVQVVDISLGGALLQSSRPVKTGAHGSLRMNVSGIPFRAEVEVQRITPGSPESGYRIGALFVDVTPEHRQVIERLTNQ
jgi:hypothetical protein